MGKCLDNLLSTGITKACGRIVGGIKKAWFIEADVIDDYTLTDVVDNITFDSSVTGAEFHSLEFDTSMATAIFEQTVSASKETKTAVVNIVLTMMFSKQNKVTRETLNQMLDMREMVVIVQDFNGEFLIAGLDENGLQIGDTNATTGDARDSMNGYEVILQREDSMDFAYHMDATYANSLLN